MTGLAYLPNRCGVYLHKSREMVGEERIYIACTLFMVFEKLVSIPLLILHLIMIRYLVILALVAIALADTPACCFNDQLLGRWELRLSKFDYTPENDRVECPTDVKVDSTIVVDLKSPNVAIDINTGEAGTWTIFYNQITEVHIGGYRYTWFADYDDSHSPDYILSYCGINRPTMAWAHADGVTTTEWACFEAENVEPIYSTNNNGTQATPGPVNPDANTLTHPTYTSTKYHREFATMEPRPFPNGRALRRPERARSAPRSSRLGTEEIPYSGDALPVEYHLTDIGGRSFVPEVRDQESCGSCWIFASTGAMMSRTMLQSNLSDPLGQTKFLSTQHVTDCAQMGQGCSGGFGEMVGKFSEDHGILTEDVYGAYTATDEQCTADQHKGAERYYYTGYQCLGGYYGAETSAEEIQWEIYRSGSVPVSILATDAFKDYESGVFIEPTLGANDDDVPRHYFYEENNHLVLATGWGVDADTGIKYWDIQNSWGAEWGENGFVRLRRGTDELGVESAPVQFFWHEGGAVDHPAVKEVGAVWYWVELVWMIVATLGCVCLAVVVYMKHLKTKRYNSIDGPTV
eukprot:gnl/Dysnectes_brevis/1336_a1500_1680.p1 GENE.gnl/Dysnectes_brevis/1336_a1500_1680~~gnl/Dysnectes_brevis/1336_a1500_1680.p1  ORF type:complete len:575 (-),score=195.30 gnl/Dysnectes_brevis/1336_a1500_1680:59-1783(-)